MEQTEQIYIPEEGQPVIVDTWEKCKECGYPLKIQIEQREDGQVEEVAYCEFCGATEA